MHFRRSILAVAVFAAAMIAGSTSSADALPQCDEISVPVQQPATPLDLGIVAFVAAPAEVPEALSTSAIATNRSVRMEDIVFASQQRRRDRVRALSRSNRSPCVIANTVTDRSTKQIT